jgi:hypothetical protein
MRSAQALLSLTLLCSTSLAAALAQDVTPAQLRQMTAAQFQAGIDKEGAEAFTQRVVKDIDPHSQDEPNYDTILNHISSGNEAWLKIAAEIGPYANIVYGDSSFGRGMNVAIAYALLENPTAVLRMRTAEDHFMNACMYPFPKPSAAFLHHYQRRALIALARVNDPKLKARKEDCRRELETFPTEKASNEQP